MTSNTQHNIRLAHSLNSLIEHCFFSTTLINPFSILQHLSICRTKDVPIPDLSQTNKNRHHPGPIEQELVLMATTLELGFEAMQSGQASIQGEPIYPSETTILIQATSLQLVALVLGETYTVTYRNILDHLLPQFVEGEVFVSEGSYE